MKMLLTKIQHKNNNKQIKFKKGLNKLIKIINKRNNKYLIILFINHYYIYLFIKII